MAKNEVVLGSFGSETEALMVEDLLRQEGIPTLLVPVGPGIGGWGATVWRPFELRVRAEDEERAREFLATLEAAARETGDEPAWEGDQPEGDAE